MENENKQLASKSQGERHLPFHERLKYERQRRGWSQAYVAEKLGSDTKSIGRWEGGKVFPSPYHRYKLLDLFEKNAKEMGLVEEGFDDYHQEGLGQSLSAHFSTSSSLQRTLDVVAQANKQLGHLAVGNQTGIREVTEVEQKIDLEQQMALLEREKQLLDIERQRIELLEKRLELQKRAVEYALEVAGKVVGTLQPNADAATRTILIQVLLPTFLELLVGKGLELPITALQNEDPKSVTSEEY